MNIYPYPTSVVRQNNLVLAELGHNPDGDVNPVTKETEQSLTIIKNFTNFGAIAFQMEQNDNNSSFPNNLTNQQIDVIWGKGFDKLDLAVRLDLTNSKIEISDNANNSAESHGIDTFGGALDPYPFGAFNPDAILSGPFELNTFGVTPAVALHLSNDNRVEAALTLRKYSLDRSITTGGVAGESWEDNGNMSYALFVRGIMNKGDRATWYPAAWYVNDDLGYTVTNSGIGVEPRDIDETYKTWGVGLSHNMRVNDNNLLIFGASVGEAKHEYDRNDSNDGALNAETKTFEEKTMLLPIFFAGLETEATSWLKIRMGATQSLENNETETTAFDGTSLKIKTHESSFDFNLGAGIRWNNLDFDLTLNEAFPMSGGWILSGDEATPATRASATYHF
ncbi:MAG TPA: hypothetical protein VFR25_02035 [Candidatus Eisenbacteria bacterium]|nr:hypothetical protein [Candidatus Eisenbacteria bacterium]